MIKELRRLLGLLVCLRRDLVSFCIKCDFFILFWFMRICKFVGGEDVGLMENLRVGGGVLLNIGIV